MVAHWSWVLCFQLDGRVARAAVAFWFVVGVNTFGVLAPVFQSEGCESTCMVGKMCL